MNESIIRAGGILLVILPAVAFGGASILFLWITTHIGYYTKNRLRQRLWAAGHAHAGVLLVLALVAFLYLDTANLGGAATTFVLVTIPAAAVFVPAAYFLSVAMPDAERPNALINLAYVGYLSLTAGLLVLGIGLLTAL
jgi:hypothetical protein